MPKDLLPIPTHHPGNQYQRTSSTSSSPAWFPSIFSSSHPPNPPFQRSPSRHPRCLQPKSLLCVLVYGLQQPSSSEQLQFDTHERYSFSQPHTSVPIFQRHTTFLCRINKISSISSKESVLQQLRSTPHGPLQHTLGQCTHQCAFTNYKDVLQE